MELFNIVWIYYCLINIEILLYVSNFIHFIFLCYVYVDYWIFTCMHNYCILYTVIPLIHRMQQRLSLPCICGRMRMTNDHERVDRVLACHVRAGLYKWIASPGSYLTGIRNINGQMRFCRREWMARGRVSIYSRRTILSRRRYVAKPLRWKHFDYFFCEKCLRNRASIVQTLLRSKRN